MIFLAIRYLLERRRQTLLTLLGVFFGTMAYVAVSGFFLGFQGYMVQMLVDNTAQVHIQARQDYLKAHQLDFAFFGDAYKHVFWRPAPSRLIGYLEVQNPTGWYQRLSADPRVLAYSPLMVAPAIFTLGKNSISANLIGCNPAQQAKVTSIATYMMDGSFKDIAAGGNRVILGDELMKRLGAGVGQTVLVSVAKSKRPIPFIVTGRYQIGNRAADLQAFGEIADIQKLNGTPNRVTEIAVRLKDYTQAARLATNWGTISPELVESWDQQFANILSMFQLQTALRYTMIATVFIVAGFGIYNVLNMTVNQKRHDIAILRSLGYDTFDIVSLFFSQGLIVGAIGASLGALAGYFFCLYLQTVPFTPAMGSNSGTLHISLAFPIYLQAVLIAIIAASLASVLPARAAGKLTPIEIIRSGT
ncbi:MAG: ABC transporter permease [Spirochaetia bacterium]|nr:ABC transporter permease [Spirochaetia bacterium]